MLVTLKRLNPIRVVLMDIKAWDFISIEDHFKDAFYSQLAYDGIITENLKIDTLIGELGFLPSNNDPKTTGI